MVLSVVVGVDGSAEALRAVDWAVRHGLPLRIVHASLWERYEGAALTDTLEPGTEPASEHALAESVVAHAAERARYARFCSPVQQRPTCWSSGLIDATDISDRGSAGWDRRCSITPTARWPRFRSGRTADLFHGDIRERP